MIQNHSFPSGAPDVAGKAPPPVAQPSAPAAGPAGEFPFIVLPRLRPRAFPPVGRGGGPSAPATSGDPVAGAGNGPVQAIEDVLTLRHQQIHQFGHTLEADLAAIARSGRRQHIAALAHRTLGDAIEDMQFNKDRGQIRRRLVKAAALTLAAIDAEDARAAAEDEEDPFHV